MKRVALALVAVLALAGCAPFLMGPAEAKTDRIADELEKLGGVERVDRQFTDKGFMKPSESSNVVVYVDENPDADDVAAIIDRFRELDWQSEPVTELSIYAGDSNNGRMTPTGLPDDLVEQESALWVRLIDFAHSSSLSYEQGETQQVRSVFGFFDDDATLASTAELLRDLDDLDFGDLPTSWNYTEYVDGEGEIGGFEGTGLPGSEALDAILAADSAVAQLGRPVSRYRIVSDAHVHLDIRMLTPEFDGLTEVEAQQLLLSTPTWQAAVAAATALEGSGEIFSLSVSSDVIGSFAAINSDDCARAFGGELPFSELLWAAWLGDRTATDGSTATVCG